MENGLQVAKKKFDEIKNIHLLEFIESDEKLLMIAEDQKENPILVIWDMYNTGKVETIPLERCFPTKYFNVRLARTYGNLLQIDDEGKIISILKKVDESESRKKNEKEFKTITSDELHSLDERHHIYPKEFKPIVHNKEPWVTDDYESTSYCLCQDEEKTLQLIVGRSTIQIWHQSKKNISNIPNKGEPFLEYIWTNGIPLNQENQENKLKIEKIQLGSNYFDLEVSWQENDQKKVKKKTIQWQDIYENMNGIRHACKTLRHLNERVKNLANSFRNSKYEEMIMYINHIIWRFIEHNPQEYRLLEFRHNVMKNLILGDCVHLIRFILFGNKENCKVRHIPRNKMWNKKRGYIKYHDIDVLDKEIPSNDLELAIYHCKGNCQVILLLQ